MTTPPAIYDQQCVRCGQTPAQGAAWIDRERYCQDPCLVLERWWRRCQKGVPIERCDDV
jgi:hypothetical protein